MTTTTSRRTILAGAVALPALAVPAFALEVSNTSSNDPIFAAIDAFKRAYAFHGECLRKGCTLEEIIFEKCRKFEANLEAERGSPQITEILVGLRTTTPDTTIEQVVEMLKWKGREMIDKENTAIVDEIERLGAEGCNAQENARRALLKTVPTTTAGAVALLQFVIEQEKRDGLLYQGANESVEAATISLLSSLQSFLQPSGIGA